MKQTGVWIDGQEAMSLRAEYNADLVAACLADVAIQNARWRQAFAAEDPYAKAGLFADVRIEEWKKVIG